MTSVESPSSDQATERIHLWDLIKDIRFAMFTARHGNGHLHSRPMTTQNAKIDVDESLWFFMSRSGESVADLFGDPVVNVAYADPSADRYVSISGTSALVEGAAKKQQLWSKLAAAWFPGGATDPDLALVRVKITHASFWDIEKSKLVQVFLMAKAAVTGRPPTELGEHAQIRMNYWAPAGRRRSSSASRGGKKAGCDPAFTCEPPPGSAAQSTL